MILHGLTFCPVVIYELTVFWSSWNAEDEFYDWSDLLLAGSFWSGMSV